MNHDEFQLAAGADPVHLSADQVQHLADCAACRAWHAELLALEARLRPALEIPVPAARPRRIAPLPPPQRIATLPARRRPRTWQYGIAATVALATAIGALLFTGSEESLAHAVTVHASGEPESFAATTAVDSEVVAKVMAEAGVQLLPGGPQVTYARNCPLRGHTVAHLVVQTPLGPVVVLVMTHERLDAQRSFVEGDYRGVLVPAAQGSLAVLGASGEDIGAVVAAVQARLRYLR